MLYGPGDVRVENRPDPISKPTDAIIQIAAAGAVREVLGRVRGPDGRQKWIKAADLRQAREGG